MNIIKDWFVSSRCGANNSCLEARTHSSGTVDIRNSSNREAGMVSFPQQAWAEFLADVKDGKFDLT